MSARRRVIPSSRRDSMLQCTARKTNQQGEKKTMSRRLKEIKIERSPRAKLSAKESLRRMGEFPERRGKFIAPSRAPVTKKPPKQEISDSEFRQRLKKISDWRKERLAELLAKDSR